MRWWYLTFLVMALVTFGYIFGLNEYQEYLVQQSDQYMDPATGTWKTEYDWQAENRRVAFLDRLRYVFMGVLSIHSLVNLGCALSLAFNDKRYIVPVILFALTTLLLAVLWVAASLPSGSMIG